MHKHWYDYFKNAECENENKIYAHFYEIIFTGPVRCVKWQFKQKKKKIVRTYNSCALSGKAAEFCCFKCVFQLHSDKLSNFFFIFTSFNLLMLLIVGLNARINKKKKNLIHEKEEKNLDKIIKMGSWYDVHYL